MMPGTEVLNIPVHPTAEAAMPAFEAYQANRGGTRRLPWPRNDNVPPPGWEPTPNAEPFAARSPQMYNPPDRPQRSFSEDYPDDSRPFAEASDRIVSDIEGNPLSARFVAGRTRVGAADTPVTASQFDQITEATTGKPLQSGSGSGPSGNNSDILGWTTVDPRTGLPTEAGVVPGMTQFANLQLHMFRIFARTSTVAGVALAAEAAGALAGQRQHSKDPRIEAGIKRVRDA